MSDRGLLVPLPFCTGCRFKAQLETVSLPEGGLTADVLRRLDPSATSLSLNDEVGKGEEEEDEGTPNLFMMFCTSGLIKVSMRMSVDGSVRVEVEEAVVGYVVHVVGRCTAATTTTGFSVEGRVPSMAVKRVCKTSALANFVRASATIPPVAQ